MCDPKPMSQYHPDYDTWVINLVIMGLSVMGFLGLALAQY